ncbi:alpha/beta fold hydrolase [Candidatus Thorarchaeota archaeon]|nr:MAG: alpha/beta fold hydrolase [Candidatus Thorarchaeota archaeon]
MDAEVRGRTRKPSPSNIAFLLIHGFCADIDEMVSLADFLYDRNIASFSVRLSGHGTKPEDLATKTWKDWYTSAKQGLDFVKSWDKQYTFISGLSMGALLSLNLSINEADLAGQILFSPAVKIGGIASKFVPLLKRIIKYREVDLSYIPEIYDLPRTKYAREPLSAIHELLKLADYTRQILSEVHIPTLIIQAGADKTIDPSSGEYVLDNIASEDKQLQVIEAAEHVITCHPTRKDAYHHVEKFIQRIIN